jgi:hypothetical protein
MYNAVAVSGELRHDSSALHELPNTDIRSVQELFAQCIRILNIYAECTSYIINIFWGIGTTVNSLILEYKPLELVVVYT